MEKLHLLNKQFNKQGINVIKLRNLLSLLPDHIKNHEIRTLFPPTEIGSITLVDQIVLLTLIKLSNPGHILEIGTFQGYTTSLFLKNTINSIVSTIDLPKTFDSKKNAPFRKSSILTSGEENDEYLKLIKNKSGDFYLNNLDKLTKERLNLIKANSTNFDFKQLTDFIDFAFIDGGHDYETILSDTKNVKNYLNKKGLIVWHDYSTSIHTDVNSFLNEYSKNTRLFHVSGSLCAFEIFDT